MGGETNGLILFFVVWSTPIVSGWVVVACDSQSYLGPAEISSSVILVQLIQGWKTQGECKMSSVYF